MTELEPMRRPVGRMFDNVPGAAQEDSEAKTTFKDGALARALPREGDAPSLIQPSVARYAEVWEAGGEIVWLPIVPPCA